MKLSKETQAIFKNFASINSNLVINAGSKLSTISSGKNILAEAVVVEDFPMEFGIYDLNEFLGALSLFGEPELQFSPKQVVIREGRNAVTYFAAQTSVLTKVPTIKTFPDAYITFDLAASMLNQIQRVSSILKVGDFSIVGKESIITVQVGDKSNPTGNSFASDIGITDRTFKINFKVENLKLMAGDYTVAIGGKKSSRFQSTTQQLLYYIALELDSEFDF